MRPAIPVVKITNHGNTNRIRCPDCKIHTGHTIDRHGMRSQFFIDIITDACTELLFLVKADFRCKSIGIIKLFFVSFPILDFHFIFRYFISRNQHSEKACLILHDHIVSLFFLCEQNSCLHSARHKTLDQNTVFCHSRSQNTARFAFLRIYNSLYFRPIHQFI